MNDSSKCLMYKHIKFQFGLEFYLANLNIFNNAWLIKLRTLNIKIPIETGRYEGIPRNRRLCSLCNSNEIADELHFLLKCEFFKDIRKKYIPEYFWSNTSAYKYTELLSTRQKNLLIVVNKYISKASKFFIKRSLLSSLLCIFIIPSLSLVF